MPVSAAPKLLCIASDRRFASMVDRSLPSTPVRDVRHVQRLDDALDRLQSESFDIVLFDSELCGDGSQHEVSRRLRRACRQTPLMIASPDPPSQPRTHVTHVAKSELDEQTLAGELLKLCAARELRLQKTLRDGLSDLMPPTAATPMAPCDVEIELLEVVDGLPASLHKGRAVRAGRQRIQVVMEQAGTLAAEVIVSVAAGGQRKHQLFSAAQRPVRDSGDDAADERATVELQWNCIDRLLRPETLCPTLHGSRVLLGLPQGAAEAWERAGVLRPTPVDRILVCPRCGSIPALRPGCRCCGSPWLRGQRMLHHYACACVAPAAEFGGDDSLQCPKCLANRLVVGVDCEHMAGPSTCAACGWSDTERAMFGRCFHCAHVFPADEANEQEVIRFHVDRLELLDFVPAP